MNLDPLLNASFAIQFHVATVIPAFIIGTAQMVMPKGTRLHRISGYIYMTLMILTAIAAFFIPSFLGGRFSYIHLFIPLTLISVPMSLWALKTGNVRQHRNSMIGLYTGGILIAGALALAPGRIMHELFF